MTYTAQSTLAEMIGLAERSTMHEIEAEVMTRPILFATDGASLTWVCDVRIPAHDSDTFLFPGQAVPEAILRRVPIAQNNRDLSFTDIGSAVTLRRNASGRFEVVGLSKRKPGRRTRIPVNLDTLEVGDTVDTTISSRVLTLGELMTLGVFGEIPLGTVGIFSGGTLLELR